MHGARLTLAAIVAGAVAVVSACSPVDEPPGYPDAVVYLSISGGEVFARAETCTQDVLVDAFTLGPAEGHPHATWTIRPVDSASARIGDVAVIRDLINNGALQLTVTGTERAVALALSTSLFDDLTDNLDSGSDMYLVASEQRPFPITQRWSIEKVMDFVCAPVIEPQEDSD